MIANLHKSLVVHYLVCALDGKEVEAIEHLQYVGEAEGHAGINC